MQEMRDKACQVDAGLQVMPNFIQAVKQKQSLSITGIGTHVPQCPREIILFRVLGKELIAKELFEIIPARPESQISQSNPKDPVKTILPNHTINEIVDGFLAKRCLSRASLASNQNSFRAL
jgi:hypothetical protein